MVTTQGTAVGTEAVQERRAARPWYRRARYVAPLLAVAAVLALVVALGVRGSETGSPPSGSGGSPAATDPQDGAFGSFEPTTASGTGRDRVPLPEGASVGVVTATYEGSGYFDVGFVRGKNAFPLISWTGVRGPYAGSVTFGLFDRPQSDSLTVWADGGPWRVTIAPISSAGELPSSVEGTKDAVFRSSGEPDRWVFTKQGADRLIVIEAVPATSSSRLPRAWTTVVDGTSAAVRLGGAGPSVVAVSADGGWSAATPQ